MGRTRSPTKIRRTEIVKEFHRVARNQHIEQIEQLIKKGLDVDHRDDQGISLVHVVAANGRTKVLSILLEHGAALTSPSNGYSPLMVTARNSWVENIELLLQQGIDVSARDERGETALGYAMEEPDQVEEAEAIIMLLLDAGADVHGASNVGFTPLHHAAWSGMGKVAGWLLERGADINGRTATGKTALDIAREKEYPEVEAVLVAAGAAE